MKTLLVGLVCLALPAGTAFAVDPDFPLLGIGLGQTLRVVAVGKGPGPAQCSAVLGFVDINGVESNPGPVSKPVNLSTGQADYLDFPASLVLTRFGQRIELRPRVQFPAGATGDNCLISAEIFDTSFGFSQVYKQPGPQQLPGEPSAFSLVGVAFGQVMRVNAVAKQPGPVSTPGPCIVQLSFFDRNGVEKNPGPAQGPLTLEPGRGGYRDFPASAMVSRFGQRALLRPVVTVSSVPGAAACAGVIATGEIFDPASGRTWSQPGPTQ